MPNAFQLAEATAALSARLRANGCSIEQTVDFAKIDAEMSLMEKGKMSLENNWLYSDLTPANAFYVVVRNAERKPIAMCAVRNYQLRNETLTGFLDRQYSRLYGNGENALDTSMMPPVSDEITGSVVYLGDFFVGREGRVSKEFNNSDFILLVYGLSMMQFDPDWLFGFARHRDAARGLMATYFMTRCYPFALNWKIETPTRQDSDWIIGMNRRDLTYLLDIFSAGRLRPVNAVELVTNKSESPQRQSEYEQEAKAADR